MKNSCLLLGLSGFTSLQAFGQDVPNIIVFLVDDMGVMDTSVPFLTDNNGDPVLYPLNTWYRTPSMERLSDQGIRFSNFYAQSVSSPSRISLMTGHNSARHRTTNWINTESNNRTKTGPLEWNWGGINKNTVTYPRILQQAGYKTIHIGKAHFGCGGSEGEDPKNIGFDVNIAGSSIGHPGSYLGENGYGLLKGERKRVVPDLEMYHGTDTFLTDALTIEACKEIKKSIDENRPFYLNMAHYAVHSPFDIDKRYFANYKDESKSKKAKAFAALVEGMDKSLGILLDFLDEFGIAENTLIFFLGDNGSNAPLGGAADYGSSAPLRGKKGSEYEGGVRVPFMASWAKNNPKNKFQKQYPIAAGKVQTQMATIMDIFPSILSVAGLVVPEGYVLDGADLKKLLTGEKDKNHRNDFLMHYPHMRNNPKDGGNFTEYIKGGWKLIYYYPVTDKTPNSKLYNLNTDPFEKNDLADSYPSKVKEMFELMKKRLDLEDALYPIDEKGRIIKPILINNKK